MSHESVKGGNLTQTLFKLNELEYKDNEKQMSSFISQSRMSTYYQDNPWGILTSSEKYGLPTLGGKINPNNPPGYKPGNIIGKK